VTKSFARLSVTARVTLEAGIGFGSVVMSEFEYTCVRMKIWRFSGLLGHSIVLLTFAGKSGVFFLFYRQSAVAVIEGKKVQSKLLEFVICDQT
jgi:hypothetical protein